MSSKTIDSYRKYSKSKLIYHTKIIEDLLSNKPVYPITAEIDLTNYCNSACVWCNDIPYRKRHMESLDTGKIKSVLEGMAEKKVLSAVFKGGGEPLYHPDAIEIIRHANNVGLVTCLITNGTLIEERNLNELVDSCKGIRISLDAGTPETYKKLHRVPEFYFEKVLDNIRKLNIRRRSQNKKMLLTASFIIYKDNLSEIEKIAQIVSDAGADSIQYKPLIKDGKFTYFDCKKELEEAKKHESDSFSVDPVRLETRQEDSKRNFSFCFACNLQASISADGNIHLCGNRKYKEDVLYSFGNIHAQSFSEIWEGKRRKEILEKIYADENFVNSCPACKMFPYNEFIEFVRKKPFLWEVI